MAESNRLARDMLARTTPFSKWAEDARPSIEKTRLWLLVARETMKLSALTPDEERAVRIALELDAAEAAMEANIGRS